MRSRSFSTPVLFIIFNRLDTTRRVFDAIRQAKPPRLYIAADGPRDAVAGESLKVQEVREYVTGHIDWPCEVKTLFREKNLGCKKAVSGAITWFFENEERGIILEDDTLPGQDFFRFCEELLEKYKDDMRVWHIGGVSTLNEGILTDQDSYYFSRFNHIWGWASWASRWKFYDVNIPLLGEFSRGRYIENISERKILQEFWLNNFTGVACGEIDSWDYQWYFATWVNGGIAIIPTVNLVINIGFGAGATHTRDRGGKLSRMEIHEISSELRHPRIMMPNRVYDKFNADFLFGLNHWKCFLDAVKKTIKKIIRR